MFRFEPKLCEYVVDALGVFLWLLTEAALVITAAAVKVIDLY